MRLASREQQKTVSEAKLRHTHTHLHTHLPSNAHTHTLAHTHTHTHTRAHTAHTKDSRQQAGLSGAVRGYSQVYIKQTALKDSLVNALPTPEQHLSPPTLRTHRHTHTHTHSQILYLSR